MSSECRSLRTGFGVDVDVLATPEDPDTSDPDTSGAMRESGSLLAEGLLAAAKLRCRVLLKGSLGLQWPFSS